MKTIIGITLNFFVLAVCGNQEVCEINKWGNNICQNAGTITRVTHPDNRDYVILELEADTTIGPNAFRGMNTWELRFEVSERESPLVLSIQPSAFAGIEYITNLDIQHANITYNGNPWADLERLKRFRCESCGFTEVPTEILASLPSLEDLVLEKSRIDTIKQNAFATSKNLTMLNLLRDERITLEPGCFNGLERLETLVIPSSSFTLTPGVFEGLNMLDTLKLVGHLNDNMTLPTILRAIPSLTTFEFVRGGLDSLQPGMFDEFQKLSGLRLSENNITHVPKNVFNQLISLYELDLNGNPIVTIEPGAFSGLQFLSLGLSSNPALEVIETGTFDGVAVGFLIISHCNISEIKPRAFSGLNASWVDLDDNKLTRIGVEDFAGLNAQVLGLGGNNLTEIVPGAFKNTIIEKLTLAKHLVPTADKTKWGLPDSVIVDAERE